MILNMWSRQRRPLFALLQKAEGEMHSEVKRRWKKAKQAAIYKRV